MRIELTLARRTEEWLMIDALFWYTGLVAWILIVFGVVSTLVIDAHDRSVMRHGEQRSTDKP